MEATSKGEEEFKMTADVSSFGRLFRIRTERCYNGNKAETGIIFPRCIQNRSKHLRWSFLRKQLTTENR